MIHPDTINNLTVARKGERILLIIDCSTEDAAETITNVLRTSIQEGHLVIGAHTVTADIQFMREA